jgi:hypothetical protein
MVHGIHNNHLKIIGLVGVGVVEVVSCVVSCPLMMNDDDRRIEFLRKLKCCTRSNSNI